MAIQLNCIGSTEEALSELASGFLWAVFMPGLTQAKT